MLLFLVTFPPKSFKLTQICFWSSTRGADISRRAIFGVLVVLWIISVTPTNSWCLIHLPNFPIDDEERAKKLFPLTMVTLSTFVLTLIVTVSGNLLVYGFFSRQPNSDATSDIERRTLARMRKAMITAFLQFFSTSCLHVSFLLGGRNMKLWNRHIHFIDLCLFFSSARERVNERASKRTSAVDRMSEANSVERAMISYSLTFNSKVLWSDQTAMRTAWKPKAVLVDFHGIV